MEQRIRLTVKHCYALIHRDDGVLDDIGNYIDKDERLIELATGAADVGKLTHQESCIVMRGCRKEYAKKGLKFLVRLIGKQEVPTNRKAELKLLLNEYIELSGDERLALGSAVDIANKVRTAYGCESKNIPNKYLTESKNTSEVTPQSVEQPKNPESKQFYNVADYVDTINETKGRWVSQVDFLKARNSNRSRDSSFAMTA